MQLISRPAAFAGAKLSELVELQAVSDRPDTPHPSLDLTISKTAAFQGCDRDLSRVAVNVSVFPTQAVLDFVKDGHGGVPGVVVFDDSLHFRFVQRSDSDDMVLFLQHSKIIGSRKLAEFKTADIVQAFRLAAGDTDE